MRRRYFRLQAFVISLGLLLEGVNLSSFDSLAKENPAGEWRYEVNDQGVAGDYWYENGIRQGTEGRGKEIYDPDTKAWYWLDAVDGGKKAVSKDVYQDSEAGPWGETAGADGKRYGKWVRYDADGCMVKGWSADRKYYFDEIYGTMAKGTVTISGGQYTFHPITGILQSGAAPVQNGWFAAAGGEMFWYENGVRQGTEGRGKEIYDPDTDAWYWLDAVDGGKKAVSKDVYQDSDAGQWGEKNGANGKKTGKWVRYDAEGRMIKGWCAGKDENACRIDSPDQANGRPVYYFDPIYGTMAKGKCQIGDKNYEFDRTTGILKISTLLPNQKAPATWDNVMAFLNAYDQDGAYLVGNVQDLWWYPNANSVTAVKGAETIVHENCHMYIWEKADWSNEAIYIGNGQHIKVEYTDVYYSTEMVPVVPEELRTFRFTTYIDTADTRMASVQQGVYGLLNEFSAYCWGTNAGVKMYAFYRDELGKNPSAYLDYVGNIASSTLAYAEFRYYILTYLLYAREYYPGVYNGIIQNENFKTAFCVTDTKYQQVVREFEGNLGGIIVSGLSNGYDAWISDDYFYIGMYGRGLFRNDRLMLMREMERPEYQEIYNLLYGK